MTGGNLRDALREAVRRGCEVVCPRRTGEVLVSHRACPMKVRVNSRRKDCPRALSVFLKRLAVPAV